MIDDQLPALERTDLLQVIDDALWIRWPAAHISVRSVGESLGGTQRHWDRFGLYRCRAIRIR